MTIITQALILWGGIRIDRRAYMMVTIFTVLFGLLGVFFLLPPDLSLPLFIDQYLRRDTLKILSAIKNY